MKYFIFLLFLLAGCSPSVEKGMHFSTEVAEKSTAPATTEFHSTIDLDCGQHVKYVEYSTLGIWLKDRQEKITIVSICPVDRSGYGSTTGFIVVYKNNEK